MSFIWNKNILTEANRVLQKQSIATFSAANVEMMKNIQYQLILKVLKDT